MARFAYYDRLDADQKRTYRRSDAIRRVEIPQAPADSGGELQGLYDPDEVTGGRARITVWMRTARRVRDDARGPGRAPQG